MVVGRRVSTILRVIRVTDPLSRFGVTEVTTFSVKDAAAVRSLKTSEKKLRWAPADGN
jgi:hypothetical protein